MPIPDSIRELLTRRGIDFSVIRHEPTFTSEQSAAARGESLRIGGKALLMRCDDEFALFVLPADRKIDSGAVRRTLPCKRLRFASAAELLDLTGLVPGSVPPFGRPVLPFPLCIDSAIEQNERIAFNAGSLTESFILAVPDYLAAAQPTRVFPFSHSSA